MPSTDYVRLGQAFYGSGTNGYSVLKTTNPQFDNIIEKFCSAIGTPDGFSTLSPFLINYPYGDCIFMACCMPGHLDRYKRKTIFFHVVFGTAQECINANIDIFTLFEQGVFISHLPASCEDLLLPPSTTSRQPTHAPFTWNKQRMAIVCEAPQNKLLEQLVGADAYSFAWASFAFAPLSGFKIYAISKYAAQPTDVVRCDTQGNVMNDQPRIERSSERASDAAPLSSSNQEQRKPSLALYVILAASLLINAIFIYRWMNYKPEVREKEVIREIRVPGPVQTKIEVRTIPAPPVDRTKLKSEVLAEIAQGFPEKYRIPDWDKTLSLPQHQMFKDKYIDSTANEYELLQKLKAYVDFTNNILNNKRQGQGE